MTDDAQVLSPVGQKKAMSSAILSQAFGTVTSLVFKNGFMLAYLSMLGVFSDKILIFLAIPEISLFLFTIPAAFLADRLGNKKVGLS